VARTLQPIRNQLRRARGLIQVCQEQEWAVFGGMIERLSLLFQISETLPTKHGANGIFHRSNGQGMKFPPFFGQVVKLRFW